MANLEEKQEQSKNQEMEEQKKDQDQEQEQKPLPESDLPFPSIAPPPHVVFIPLRCSNCNAESQMGEFWYNYWKDKRNGIRCKFCGCYGTVKEVKV